MSSSKRMTACVSPAGRTAVIAPTRATRRLGVPATSTGPSRTVAVNRVLAAGFSAFWWPFVASSPAPSRSSNPNSSHRPGGRRARSVLARAADCPRETRRSAPVGLRRTAVRSSGERRVSRSATVRNRSAAGTDGPGVRSGPAGTSRCASVVSAAGAVARSPAVNLRQRRGRDPERGHGDARAAGDVARLRTPHGPDGSRRRASRHRRAARQSSGRVKSGPGAISPSSGTRSAASSAAPLISVAR